ncbi:MAG: AMIN domain-containing protein, partial [bacterium]
MKKIILCLILLVISLFSISIQANNIHIYINGEEETEFLEAIIEEDNVLVKAQSLAELFNAELRWRKSIQTLSLSSDNTNIKMMVDNPYIQVNKRTSRCPVGMKMINGSNYIPLKEIAENLGFLYEKNGDDIYISNPQTLIENVTWGEDGQQIKIEMDKISPYRINPTDDPNRLEVELDKAALAEDFTDNLSNSNYYLRVNRVANQARIKFTIISNKPIPFINDNNIEENGDDLLLNFLPSITEIRWENQELEILSNGEISRPEIMLLQEPRRLVLDIPNLMLQNYELDIKENEWVKDVRVSQFKLDPVVLRVVLDLHEDKYLHLDEDIKDEDRVVLETSSDKTMLDNLNFADNRLEFTSDNPIVPDIFHLEDPERLVVNIMNADRGDSFDSDIDVDGNIVSQIRTSRFNEETIRLVVDLNEMTGYKLKEESLSDGRIKHIISFENNFEDILLSDSNSRTNINLKFSGSVKYETKKFSYPDRFVIDVEGADLREDYELPEGVGVIKDIRVSQFSNEPQITRFVFETDKYEDYNLFSMDTNTSINISFLKETT